MCTVLPTSTSKTYEHYLLIYLLYCNNGSTVTSSSVWFNIPIATCILVFLRYLSMEWEIHKRAETPDIPSHLAHLAKYQLSVHSPLLSSPPISMTWRRKFESPAIEASVDNFTRHIVKEFVTDSWYSGLSPDRNVPEQIRYFIKDILAELGQRIKRINLINLITRYSSHNLKRLF